MQKTASAILFPPVCPCFPSLDSNITGHERPPLMVSHVRGACWLKSFYQWCEISFLLGFYRLTQQLQGTALLIPTRSNSQSLHPNSLCRFCTHLNHPTYMIVANKNDSPIQIQVLRHHCVFSLIPCYFELQTFNWIHASLEISSPDHPG